MAEYSQIANLRGPRGPVGPPPQVGVGTVETVDFGEGAEVRVSGSTAQTQNFSFKIPRGLPGVNSVNNDVATRELINTVSTETRTALDAQYLRRGQVPMTTDNLFSDQALRGISDTGELSGDWLRGSGQQDAFVRTAHEVYGVSIQSLASRRQSQEARIDLRTDGIGVPVTPGEKIAYTFRSWSAGSTGLARFRVRYADLNGNYVATSVLVDLPPGVALHNGEITVPTNPNIAYASWDYIVSADSDKNFWVTPPLIRRKVDANVLDMQSITGSTPTITALWEALKNKGTIVGDDGKNYHVIGGTMRNDGDGWYPHVNAAHETIGVTSMETTDQNIRLNYYGNQHRSIVTVIAVPDEALAARGITVGASVDANYCSFHLGGKVGYSGYVEYLNGSWVVNTNSNDAGLITASWDAQRRTVRVQHPELPVTDLHGATDLHITGRSSMRPYVSPDTEPSRAELGVAFLDAQGNRVGEPSAGTRFYFSHNTTGPLDPRRVTTTLYPYSNIWYFGLFRRND